MVNKLTSEFETNYIEEPDLVFGNKKEDKDPKIGLSHHGPYHYHDEELPLTSVRIGIVGNQECLTYACKILDLIQMEIKNEKPNHWLFPDYPGMNKQSPFKCSIIKSSQWNGLLTNDYDLKKIKEFTNANERIAYGVNLYVNKIEQIKAGDDVPDVVICTLPDIVEKYCGISELTRGAKQPRLSKLEKTKKKLESEGQSFLDQWGHIEAIKKTTEKSYDFRNSLKGKVMRYGIPIQLIKETVMCQIINYEELGKHQTETPATFSWNFGTALYYKASGKPWRLAKLHQDTCYVGISFFRDKLHPNNEIQISMAQVFTHDGEGLVLRGSEVKTHEYTKQPYLKKEQARVLMERAIAKYTERTRKNPTRVVIHKSSIFFDEEKNGFSEAIYKYGNLKKDFVAISSPKSSIIFLRPGNFPVIRGTIINIGDHEFLLYTSGYAPRIRTYAGHGTPNPLKIVHHGDSNKNEIAKEILNLTKLNWNTTSFSTHRPITIQFADQVGKILSELKDDSDLQDHYKFFM